MIYPVVLAGAGPGDEELITIKLQKNIAIADIIITDRLVNPLIITNNCSSNAVIIKAGKQGYNQNSYTQSEINAIIVEYALAGKRVLRLKGGDIALYSNVLDELEALLANQIPFEIIPGISAFSGASAYTGMPLTAKGYSRGVQIVSFNQTSEYSNADWQRMAASKDSLVVYMGGKNMKLLVQLLVENGLDAATPIAIISEATTTYQNIQVNTLKGLLASFPDTAFVSPSLIIIGAVVELYKKFNWFKPSIEVGSVFNELEEKIIGSCN